MRSTGNRQRKVWDDLAARLAAAGINTLTLDMRGFGEKRRCAPRYFAKRSPCVLAHAL
jgi:alpha-beta hydrolase superfamily lysophospholipase